MMENQQNGPPDVRDGAPLPNNTHASQVTASLTVTGMDQLQTSRTDVRDGTVSLGHHRGIIQQTSQVMSVGRESDTVTAQLLVQAGDENSTVPTNLNSRSHTDDNYNNGTENDLLKRENERLKGKKKCFICRNVKFKFVAVPCEHTFCSKCSAMTKCRCGSDIIFMHVSILPPPNNPYISIHDSGLTDVRDGAPLLTHTHASQVTASITVTGMDQLQTSRTEVRDGTVSLGHHRGIIEQASQVMSVSRESDTVTAQSLVQAGDAHPTTRTNLNSRSHSDENYNNNNNNNVNDLLAENNQLKETKKCFGCKNKDFQYVAVPCGHTFCSDCTDRTECRCGSKIDYMHESKLATSS